MAAETLESPRGPRTRGALNQVVWTTAGFLALPLTSLITGPILARALAPVGRGELAAIIQPVTFFTSLAALGIPSAATYYIASRKLDPLYVLRRLLPAVLAIGTLVTAVMIVLAPELLHNYHGGVLLFRIAALTVIPALCFGIVRGGVLGRQLYWRANAEQWIFSVLRMLAIAALAAAGALTVGAGIAASLLPALVGACILLPVLRGRRRGAAEDVPRRAILWYGIRGWGGSLTAFANLRLDQVLLVPLVGPVQLGYYAVAVSLAEIPLFLVNGIQRVVFIESSARHDMSLVARAGRCTTLVVGTAAVGGVAISSLAVRTLFGGAFGPATLMAQILFVSVLPQSLAWILSTGLLSSNRPGRYSAAQSFAVCVTIPGLLLLVPWLGAEGAAWTSLAAYSTAATVVVFWLRKVCGLNPRECLVPRREDIVWLASVAKRLRREWSTRPRTREVHAS